MYLIFISHYIYYHPKYLMSTLLKFDLWQFFFLFFFLQFAYQYSSVLNCKLGQNRDDNFLLTLKTSYQTSFL